MTDLFRKALIFVFSFNHSSLVAYQATRLIYLWVAEPLKFALPHVIGSIGHRAQSSRSDWFKAVNAEINMRKTWSSNFNITG